MKRYYRLFLLLIIFNFVSAKALTTERAAFLEMAESFYRKGVNIQYSDDLIDYDKSAMCVSNQHIMFTTCSGFVTKSLKLSLDMDIPLITRDMTAWARDIYNIEKDKKYVKLSENNFHLKFNTYTDKKAKEEAQYRYWEEVIQKLEEGDVIVTYFSPETSTNNGHIFIINKLIKDDNGKIVNFEVIHSTGNHLETHAKKDIFKLDNYELHWTSKVNKDNNYNSYNAITKQEEGTIGKVKGFLNGYIDVNGKRIIRYGDKLEFGLAGLNFLKNITSRSKNVHIISPIAYENDQAYYYKSDKACTKDNNLPSTSNDSSEKTKCTYKKSPMTLTKEANFRLKNKDFDFKKTSSKFNKNTVKINDVISYELEIKNNSNQDYNNIVITEEISPYVELIDKASGVFNNNKLTFNLTIPKNTTKKIIYKTKVKGNLLLLNRATKIISKTTINDIPLCPLEHDVDVVFNDVDNDKIKKSYQKLINSSTSDVDLMNKIYKDVYDFDLNLDNLDLATIMTLKGIRPDIDKNNRFTKLRLNNYFNKNIMLSPNTSKLSFGHHPHYKDLDIIRDDFIYKEHLKPGDILIYNHSFNSKDTPELSENGTYAFIYVEENNKAYFKGKNKNIDLSTYMPYLEKIDSRGNKVEMPIIHSIFDKDSYMIIRPSKEMFPIITETKNAVINVSKNHGKNNENISVDVIPDIGYEVVEIKYDVNKDGTVTSHPLNKNFNLEGPTKVYAKVMPKLYKFSEEEKATYIKGINLRFKINEKDVVLKELKINDKVLDKSNYIIENQTMIINIKPEYLDGLAKGTYKLTAIYNDKNGEEQEVNTYFVKRDGNTLVNTGHEKNIILPLFFLSFITFIIAAILKQNYLIKRR